MKKKNILLKSAIGVGTIATITASVVTATSCSCSKPTDITSYLQAYCDGSLQVGFTPTAYIHVTAVGVTLPTSGSNGISNLPNGVSGEWQEGGIIALSGTPLVAETKLVKIVVGNASTETSIIVTQSPSVFQDIEAYYTGLLLMNVEIDPDDIDAPQIHVYAINVTLPEEGTPGGEGVGNLPNGVTATWGGTDNNGDRIIILEGTPTGTDPLKLVQINVGGIQTQVSISIQDPESSYIQAYCDGPLTVGETPMASIFVRKNGDDIVFPSSGTSANSYFNSNSPLPTGINGTWGGTIDDEGNIAQINLSGIPSCNPGTYIVRLDIEGLDEEDYYCEFTITIFPQIPIPTSINLTYSLTEYIFSNNAPSSTGIPTLIDNEGQVASANFNILQGTLPQGLVFNDSTGEISGQPNKVEQQEIVIQALGNGQWLGLNITQTICIKVVSIYNAIVLTDGTVVNITNPDGLMVLHSNSSTRLSNTTYTSAAISNVNLIKEIHITPKQSITTAPDEYGYYLCYGMTNLTVADVILPQSITSVNNFFCNYMFYDCSKLTILTGFNLPQGITSVGTYFCANMFVNCSALTTLPTGFNLPQDITSVGNFFCTGMFYNCSSLTSLPSGFNLPSGITSVGSSFCYGLFQSCSSLTILPTGFNLPQGITSVGVSFCESMFDSCSSLNGLGNSEPRNFKCGVNTSSGTDFAKNMFNGATNLINAGCPGSPTNAQLKTGYNIARS